MRLWNLKLTEFLNLTNIAGELFDKVVAYAVLKLACPCSAGEKSHRYAQLRSICVGSQLRRSDQRYYWLVFDP